MIRMKTLLITTAIGSIGVGFSAHATAPAPLPTELGVLPLGLSVPYTYGDQNTNGITGTAFSNVYTFSISNPASLSVVSGSVPFLNTAISGLTVTIDNFNASSPSTPGTFVAGGTGPSVTYAGLSTNTTYDLVVSGVAQKLGGVFSFTTQITPSTVPIPGAIVLFGSGLVGLAALSRRKAKAQTA